MIKSNYLMYSSSQPSFLLNPVYVRLCLMNVDFYSRKKKEPKSALFIVHCIYQFLGLFS